ncbi:MAG TPA: C1 family peptidase [Fimbriimonas sp.]|nr:C1 family peptidase [Fimbriimonas sp.]
MPSQTLAATEGALRSVDVAQFQAQFDADTRNRASMNAICTTPVNKVAVNRATYAKIDHSFSLHLPENPITAQKGSGRCWMFAALNTFRTRAAKTMNLEAFELSQNYTMFWDKLEKSNYFLESILQTLDEPIGSRLLDWLLANIITDGGQWDMFVNLIDKYGVVPKSVMPETESSSSTGNMNYQVTFMLRDYACRLRKANEGGSTADELRKLKDDFMSEVYRMLVIHLGEPAKEFDWQWRDKDKQFHRAGTLTPTEFYGKYVDYDLKDMVCLVHDPRHPTNTAMTVKFLGNVVGGRPTEYLNTDLETIKCAAIKHIESGESVWFGCDVGKYLDGESGVMDIDLFQFDLVYGCQPTMTKAERLMYGHSLMTHAMVFTGVDVGENDQPRKWRVENSWGDERGQKGWFQMSDKWFDEFNYEVVVHKSHVPAGVLETLTQQPIELEPWDPMGSLAL